MNVIEQIIFTVILIVSLLQLVSSNDSLKQCIPHIRSCCNLRTSPTGDVPSGQYKMKLGAFVLVDAYLDMTTDGGGWIVIQRNRNNSKLSFNKNWREYENGFGDLNDDFWAGLKLMNILTSSGQWEMRVDFQNNDNTWSYLHYNQFSVRSASDGYRLTVSEYTDGSGDYFAAGTQPANNSRFSTYDNDNDVNTGDCASHWRCGWWYHRCFNINPNNQPPMSNWPTTVLFIEMKIRPKG